MPILKHFFDKLNYFEWGVCLQKLYRDRIEFRLLKQCRNTKGVTLGNGKNVLFYLIMSDQPKHKSCYLGISQLNMLKVEVYDVPLPNGSVFSSIRNQRQFYVGHSSNKLVLVT